MLPVSFFVCDGRWVTCSHSSVSSAKAGSMTYAVGQRGQGGIPFIFGIPLNKNSLGRKKKFFIMKDFRDIWLAQSVDSVY